MARLKEVPEDPKAEFMVAIAGPVVNVVIALLLFLVVPMDVFFDMDAETLQDELSSISAHNFLFYLFTANIALAAFNMLPAFPLDGGRNFFPVVEAGRLVGIIDMNNINEFLRFRASLDY